MRLGGELAPISWCGGLAILRATQRFQALMVIFLQLGKASFSPISADAPRCPSTVRDDAARRLSLQGKELYVPTA
jgi:hypothetical protein